jgi:hypothetical protein
MDRKSIGLFVAGTVLGLFSGGMIWGTSKPVVTKTETVTVERTVVVERVVTVDVVRTIIMERHTTADREEIIETRGADGTLSIRTERYGLRIDDFNMTNETLHLSDSLHAQTQESAKTSSSTMITPVQRNWIIGGGFFINPLEPVSFDYRLDWSIWVSRRAWDSPFFLTGFGGPKYIGLGMSAEF